MKERIHFLSLITVLTLLVTACSESDKQDEFHDWKSRNEAYVDSLAGIVGRYESSGVTYSNAKPGDMFRILSYKLDPAKSWGIQDYTYCQLITKGSGSESPVYSDSIRINYRGRLIPTPEHPSGYTFDQSYKTEKLDPEVNVPAPFLLSDLVNGMISSISYMRVGDVWRIHIPYSLGYSKTKKDDIPAYSTLVFDVHLVSIAHTGISF